ncbi:MAG: hypothetical protein GY950_28180 [bacterium]|nr:hypothetical protein [bacterium]
MKNKIFIQSILLCVLLCLAVFSPAKEEKKISFDLKQVSGNVYCLYGNGGDIGWIYDELKRKK